MFLRIAGGLLLTASLLAFGCTADTEDLDVGVSSRALTAEVIVDNGDPEYTEVGAWATSANGGFGGTGSRFISAGTGTNSATWTAALPSPGTYRVSAWWVASTNRAPDAVYTVRDAGGGTSVTVDQTSMGDQWNVLGEFQFDTTVGEVVLTDLASTGLVSADAIRFESTDDLVIDNRDAGYSELGSWSSSANPGFIGTDSRFTGAGTGADVATWAFQVGASGEYDVQAWWIASSNRAPDAPYTVTHDGGVDTVRVDQTTGGGAWNDLGRFFFVAGTTYQVSLSDDAEAGTFISADAIRIRAAGRWDQGDLSALPPPAELRALPGGSNGVPSIVSNNPEVYTGRGLLYGTGRASKTRGGDGFPIEGEASVYNHHINRTGEDGYVQVLVTNPNFKSVRVSGFGSVYNQEETGGLAIGASPDYRVSEDWATGNFNTDLPTKRLKPFRAVQLSVKDLADGDEIDGRFAIDATGPVKVYVIATKTPSLIEAVFRLFQDAEGDIATPGTPPPPFGREAGVYDGDTWESEIDLTVPPAGQRIGFFVNTATGTGLSQIQAFPALTNYSDSAAEAVGMYGNFYDVTITLTHDDSDAQPRTVDLALASYGGGTPSRFWDGAAVLNGSVVPVLNTPSQRIDVLGTVTIQPGQTETFTFRAMVPGLTSIYQGLWLSSR
ncbi:MAG: DUF3370 family protein [Myxococcota bacterium]